MRLGIGGGAFGIRGGISTRGVGVGVGPFSAGTSWRGGRSSGSGGGGSLFAWLIAAAVLFFIAAWPYLLGTFIAVQCGAWNPSTERFVTGWCFETVYIAAFAAVYIHWRASRVKQAAEEARQMAALVGSGAVYPASHGSSTVYRHGACTSNHKSADTASRCRKSSPDAERELAASMSVSDAPPSTGTANRQAALWAGSILAVGLIVGLGIQLGDPIHSPAQEATTKPCPPVISIDGKAASITVPDVVGQNAQAAETRLKGLGLTTDLSSANPEYKSVWVASNWTVVSTDPAPGCTVGRGRSVTVYVTK